MHTAVENFGPLAMTIWRISAENMPLSLGGCAETGFIAANGLAPISPAATFDGGR